VNKFKNEKELTLKDFEDRKQNGKRIVFLPFCG
jgi:hypothetical protein